jgi:predicted nucleic-acid-binding protein
VLAIDTNVVVRFLTADDPDQARRAKALIENHRVMASSTVLLEAEWVLRSGYGFSKEEVLRALRTFSGLRNLSLQEPERVAQAMDWAEGGLDFADALHLAAAADCEAFVTFDRRLMERAKRLDSLNVRDPD